MLCGGGGMQSLPQLVRGLVVGGDRHCAAGTPGPVHRGEHGPAEDACMQWVDTASDRNQHPIITMGTKLSATHGARGMEWS